MRNGLPSGTQAPPSQRIGFPASFVVTGAPCQRPMAATGLKIWLVVAFQFVPSHRAAYGQLVAPDPVKLPTANSDVPSETRPSTLAPAACWLSCSPGPS